MRTLACLLALVVLATTATAQKGTPADSTGLPGDSFSLEGALELFKNAKDLEAFERAVNEEANTVNNLDLDGDGQVDYIRVVGHREGEAQAIVLQVALSKEEKQDVAVIELEKTGEAEARLQIRGAEELYGTDRMVEPITETDAGMEPSRGPAAPDPVRVHVWVNVWSWPCVGYLYGPTYFGWDSPWYWGYYPPWYRPWRPMGWRSWYGWGRPYHVWYRPVYTCHVPRAHAVYRPRAMYSPRIHRNTAPIRQQRATMRPAPTDRRVTPGAHPTDRRLDRRAPDNRGKGTTPRTRPTERSPRTAPAPQRPARTTPVQRTPRSPAPARSPSRSPGKR